MKQKDRFGQPLNREFAPNIKNPETELNNRYKITVVPKKDNYTVDKDANNRYTVKKNDNS